MNSSSRKAREIEELLTKTSLILTTLYEEEINHQPINLSSLSLKSHTTYYWVGKKVEILERLGLVKTKKEGRLKFIHLTKKGREVASLIKKIVELL